MNWSALFFIVPFCPIFILLGGWLAIPSVRKIAAGIYLGRDFLHSLRHHGWALPRKSLWF